MQLSGILAAVHSLVPTWPIGVAWVGATRGGRVVWGAKQKVTGTSISPSYLYFASAMIVGYFSFFHLEFSALYKFFNPSNCHSWGAFSLAFSQHGSYHVDNVWAATAWMIGRYQMATFPLAGCEPEQSGEGEPTYWAPKRLWMHILMSLPCIGFYFSTNQVSVQRLVAPTKLQ